MWQLGVLSGLFLASCCLADLLSVADRDCRCIPFNECKANGRYTFNVSEFSSCPKFLDVCCKNVNVDGQQVTPSQQSSCRHKNGKFLSMVAVLNKDPYRGETYGYAGSLIHPQAVLTSAMKIGRADPTGIKVRAGNQERDVAHIEKHNHWSSGTRWNDLAILFLSSPFDLDENVEIACLPENEDQFEKSNCLTLGFDYNQQNHQLTQKQASLSVVIPYERCNEWTKQLMKNPRYDVDPNVICTSGNPGIYMCGGYGGAPLVCPMKNDSTRYFQAGVISWGPQCDSSTPTFNSGVAPARKWIDEAVAAKITRGCGHRANGDFPSLVAIVPKYRWAARTSAISGTLIHPQVVLTSAAELTGLPSYLKVRAGGQERAVKKIIEHRSPADYPSWNDVAIFILKSPFDSAENIGYMCLPRSTEEFENSRCINSGWNMTVSGISPERWTQQKREELPIIPHEKCTTRMFNLGYYVDRTTICAGNVAGNEVFRGYSGSPLACPMKNDPTRYALAGVGFWHPPGNSMAPSVHTSVMNIRSWIDSIMKMYHFETFTYIY